VRDIAARAFSPFADSDSDSESDSYSDADADAFADACADSGSYTDASPNADTVADASAVTDASGVDTASGRCVSGRRWSRRNRVADRAASAVARVAKIHAAAQRLARGAREPVRKFQANLIFGVLGCGGVEHRE
jgi:hypothetical protein